MAKTKLALAQARDLAQRVANVLTESCQRVEIAGSIRRERSTVGDIELVCIPKHETDLLGQAGDSLLDAHLEQLLRQGRLKKRTKNGPRYKQFHLCRTPIIQMDLFITTPECWPIIFAIRTGPADFARAFVTPRAKGGLLRNGCCIQDGRLYDGGSVVDLDSERQFFERYVQGGWRDPHQRGLARQIKCVQCGRIKAVRRAADGNFWCDYCKILFDAVEDGSIGYGPPDQRIFKNERRHA